MTIDEAHSMEKISLITHQDIQNSYINQSNKQTLYIIK